MLAIEPGWKTSLCCLGTKCSAPWADFTVLAVYNFGLSNLKVARQGHSYSYAMAALKVFFLSGGNTLLLKSYHHGRSHFLC